ncbi:hypothetical protein BX600DRAFT_446390 [Xylariales sp. PMI_506]|nr:hypothetical protein BX600DRAFT_446390 [Xylariales sp. PMI_506]
MVVVGGCLFFFLVCAAIDYVDVSICGSRGKRWCPFLMYVPFFVGCVGWEAAAAVAGLRDGRLGERTR